MKVLKVLGLLWALFSVLFTLVLTAVARVSPDPGTVVQAIPSWFLNIVLATFLLTMLWVLLGLLVREIWPESAPKASSLQILQTADGLAELLALEPGTEVFVYDGDGDLVPAAAVIDGKDLIFAPADVVAEIIASEDSP